MAEHHTTTDLAVKEEAHVHCVKQNLDRDELPKPSTTPTAAPLEQPEDAQQQQTETLQAGLHAISLKVTESGSCALLAPGDLGVFHASNYHAVRATCPSAVALSEEVLACA